MEAFLWNVELKEYIETVDQTINIDQEYIDYYHDLAEEANQLVNKINATTLASILPKLMAIDEKCTLVIFYIFNGYALENDSAGDTIQLIEQEYKKTHREKYIFDMPEYETWSISQRIH
ncbi:hypothetical protein UAW_02542 [Enterococcus haemoperoxidus ATCC BAA-382]|uniref:Uncharacterized protein n=1 Tax=Enterococcus haemoperoxidus ATCC BAA-382 TaxID=1158608 RepID=R2SZ28_9ENTE|nr:hypothetical protein [Enterococcus haemoperoxidus]EOH93294.1 hypothetical protein UAW_02542 [Enterococcus haemoperoxidus ATCC BAA-382]EOT61249.1 hypothetical protein I583_00227 [Enterococcus haemoperoxidus ATCC BAA-382]OJG54429.1 hypothetical protein RV06_GL002772 [Enterococcus haemoperoxidus]